jgi:actin-related protein
MSKKDGQGIAKWHKMWPLYNRMFEHRFVNTTNLVERLWQYIKYTLFKKQVNCKLDILVWALIGK